MKNELDQQLCEKFPKLFKNRYGDMTTTAMCWGFECGDGWYEIINSLCSNIQHYIDQNRKHRANAIQYNRVLSRAIDGDTRGLVWWHSWPTPTEHTYKSVEQNLANPRFRTIPDIVTQVTVDQVKEKFGTLHFYYSGGDDYIRGLVHMAESISETTCEECGNQGKIRMDGWIRTLCEEHNRHDAT
jgi:hypothetical protein